MQLAKVILWVDPEKNRVTKITIDDDDGDSFIPDEIARLSGHKIIPGDEENTYFPEGKFVLENIAHKGPDSDCIFFQEELRGMAEFSIAVDENFVNKSSLIKELESLRQGADPDTDVKLASLINYIAGNDWDWTCSVCGSFVSREDLKKNLLDLCCRCSDKK